MEMIEHKDLEGTKIISKPKILMSGNDTQGFIPALLSLQESAINTIVTNIGGYRDLIKKKISPPMRKIVFDKAMERIEDIEKDQLWAALPYLGQNRTTESFSTGDFASIFRLKGTAGEISKGRVSMEEFLQYLIDFVPNLRQLEIRDPRSIYFFMSMFEEVRLEPLATDLLLKMENLTRFTINGVHIQFSGFMRVCRESRNLQYIEARNILVDIEPINSMKDVLETLYPKFDHQKYENWDFPREIGLTLERTGRNSITPYREASATLSNDFLDHIPSPLTYLNITPRNPSDIQCKRDCFLRNLRRLGGPLKGFRLEDVGPEWSITFNDIFEHCHELESLRIYNSFVSHDEPIASFGKLKKFLWYDWGRVSVGTTPRLDRIFLAPLLERIDIVSIMLDLGDKESLLNQIRNRSILTELVRIQLLLISHTGSTFMMEYFDELADELRFRGVEADIRYISD